MEDPAAVISVEHLTYEYPGTVALADVSFHVPRGAVVALVGPNGAGKTTLLRCLAALERPLSGRIVVNGADALAEPRACHRHLGYLADSFGVYEDLTVRQCLQHAAAMHGFSRARQAAAVDRAAGRLGIGDRLDQRTGTLSRGWRQRVAIAQAVAHEPAVVLLDEPASGLDPEARDDLAALFVRLREEGMTLVVSSHILSELEAYSTHMLALRAGRVLAHEPLGRAGNAGERVPCDLTLSRPVPGLAELLAGIPGALLLEADGCAARLSCPADAEAMERILRALVEKGLPVCGFARAPRSMQDVYLGAIRQAPAEARS